MATPREQLKNGYDPALGIFRAEGAPKAYRWAIDRLVKEFGWEAVRISIPNDYGFTQMVAVMFENGEGRAFPLKEVYLGDPVYKDDGDISHWEKVDSFDLNDAPQALDKLIDDLKAVRDGNSS